MSNQPHYAQINFTIDVFRVNPDGSLDPSKMTNHELEAHGILNKAIFGVQGFSQADCINKLKQVLEGLKYDE